MQEKYMLEAIKEAKKAQKIDEVPIGAIIVLNDKIIARAYNQKEKKQQASSHAEIEVINKASKHLCTWRLEDCDLYVTLEPCPMCAGAIMQSRIRNVYYGAYDKKGGVLSSLMNLYDVNGFNHYPKHQGGILEEECSQLLSNYFKNKREMNKKTKKKITLD